MPDLIRLLIADDHAVVRYGLCALIETAPDLCIVGQAADGVEAVELAQQLQPDVILLDLLMPRMGGQQAIQEIRAANPYARILVLTSFADDDKVYPALKAGALGYLLKDSLPQALLEAIRAVYRGEVLLHPLIARKLADEIDHPSAEILKLPPTEAPLTAQELNVLRHVAQGLANQEIAEK